MASPSSSNDTFQIPVIDISAFTIDGHTQARKETAAKLADCCRRYGCAGIAGHGVSLDLLQKAFGLAKRLFDLPKEEKIKAPRPEDVMVQRGYIAPNQEKTSGKTAVEAKNAEQKEAAKKIMDYKETYDIGSEDNPATPNVWLPSEILPELRPFMVELFWTLNKLGSALLDALIMGAGMNEKEQAFLRKAHNGHNNQLRLAHYLSAPVEDLKKETQRLAAHRDFSSFTLLFQDPVGGLQFQNRETGQFISAPPYKDVVYLNIGDMFMRYSNGYFPSSLHRVTIPEQYNASPPAGDDDQMLPDRYSIPYFVIPDAEGIVYPQPSRVIADQVANYEPILYKSFAEELFAAILSVNDE